MLIRIITSGDRFTWRPDGPGWAGGDTANALVDVPDDVLESWTAVEGAYEELQRHLNALYRKGQSGRPDAALYADQEPPRPILDEPALTTVSCPQCEAVGTLSVEWKLVARPIGSHSLAGAQVKVSAQDTPHLVCSECGFSKAASPTGRFNANQPPRPQSL
jgi:hypothetical protein